MSNTPAVTRRLSRIRGATLNGIDGHDHDHGHDHDRGYIHGRAPTEDSMLSPEFDWFALVILPLLIFMARIFDVSCGTLRIVFISRNLAIPASLIGFFESMFWLLAVTQIIQRLSSPLYYVAYAGGFAAGNFVGLQIERRLAIGTVVVRVFTRREVEALVAALGAEGHGVTQISGEGLTGPVSIVNVVVSRKKTSRVLDLLRTHNPDAFYTIEPIASARASERPPTRTFFPRFARQRK